MKTPSPLTPIVLAGLAAVTVGAAMLAAPDAQASTPEYVALVPLYDAAKSDVLTTTGSIPIWLEKRETYIELLDQLQAAAAEPAEVAYATGEGTWASTACFELERISGAPSPIPRAVLQNEELMADASSNILVKQSGAWVSYSTPSAYFGLAVFDTPVR